jgi:small subunit ribosomal protein S17
MSNNEQAKIERSIEGRVISDKMDKTVVVLVERRVTHSKYKKVIKRSTKLHAHNEMDAKEGNTVKIIETKPYSKTKTWKVIEVIS